MRNGLFRTSPLACIVINCRVKVLGRPKSMDQLQVKTGQVNNTVIMTGMYGPFWACFYSIWNRKAAM